MVSSEFIDKIEKIKMELDEFIIQIAVLFYEQRDKKNWFQFSKAKELVCWERWAITMSLAQPNNEQGRSLLYIFTYIR